MGDAVFLIDEPSLFAPRAEWLEHRVSLAEIVNEYVATPELERMLRRADALLAAKADGSPET